jgi:hypothetical protein
MRSCVRRAFGQRSLLFACLTLRICFYAAHLSPEAAAALKHSMRDSTTALAVMSLQLLPTSANEIVLQLRNQWLIVLDTSSGIATKLHTPVKGARWSQSQGI